MAWTTENDSSILIWVGSFKSEDSLKDFAISDFSKVLELPNSAISLRRRRVFFANNKEKLLSQLPYLSSYKELLNKALLPIKRYNSAIVLSEHQTSLWPPPSVHAAKFVGRFEVELSSTSPTFLDSNCFCIWVGNFTSKQDFQHYFSIKKISQIESSKFAIDFGVVAVDYELASFNFTDRMKPESIEKLIASFGFSKQIREKIVSKAKLQNLMHGTCIFIQSGLNYDQVCTGGKINEFPYVRYLGTFRWKG